MTCAVVRAWCRKCGRLHMVETLKPKKCVLCYQCWRRRLAQEIPLRAHRRSLLTLLRVRQRQVCLFSFALCALSGRQEWR